MAKSTVEGRENCILNFELFLVEQHSQDRRWPDKIKHLTEDQANDQSMHERFAYHMFSRDSSRGNGFEFGTMKNIVRGIAQVLKESHGKPGSSLSKLDIQKNWISKIISNLARKSRGSEVPCLCVSDAF